MRAELIAEEMASAVRLLGGDGSAKEQVLKAARAVGLSYTTIERLRWKKIKRIPADIADAVREAVEKHNEEGLARAKHEAFIARQAAEIMAARLAEIGGDKYRAEIDHLRSALTASGHGSDRMG